MNALHLAGSDVSTFHEYNDFESLGANIRRLTALGRPALCAEFMVRTRGSRFETLLPVFK